MTPTVSTTWEPPKQKPGPAVRLLAELLEKRNPGAGDRALDGGPLFAGATLADAIVELVEELNAPGGPKLRDALRAAEFRMRLLGNPHADNIAPLASFSFRDRGRDVHHYFGNVAQPCRPDYRLPVPPLVHSVRISLAVFEALADLFAKTRAYA